MRTTKLISRYLLGSLFVVVGLNHFLNPHFYLRIMPPYLSWHRFLVYLSGLCEIALGVLLLTRKDTRMAAWGLILLLIAVFPANLHMALHPELFPRYDPVILWLRLPVQGLLIMWAHWHVRVD